MFVPYAAAGPGFFIDDWFTLRNAEVLGWWRSAGPDQWAARPGASLVYALTFGLIGRQPLLHFALAAAIVTATAVIIHHVGRRLLPPLPAFCLALLWLLVPNHTSLEMWPSALNIALALLLLVIGLERLTTPTGRFRADLVAAALLGASVLTYEATAPVAAVAVAIVAWGRTGRRRWEAFVPSIAAIGGAGMWMLLHWHPEKKGLDAWIDVPQVIAAHFGQSVTGERVTASLLSTCVLVVSALVAYRGFRSGRDVAGDWATRLLLAGWAVILLGALPFVRYFYAPLGLGDRVTVVSGVGGAMVVVAAAAVLSRWWQIAGVVLAAFVVVVAIPQRVTMVRHYAIGADDSREILRHVAERWPSPPEYELVFGPEPIVERNVVAFYEMTLPLRLLYGKPVPARLTFEPDEFFSVPTERRVDLRAVSRLDDGKMGAD